jgi:hypothetical protein
MDFDISADGAHDRIDFDATNKMSYTYSTQGGTYAAIKLISSGQLHHYAFDKDGSSNGSFTPDSYEIDMGFSYLDKYYSLSTSPNRDIAGTVPNGNDVADMMSSGPFMINSGDSVIVTFALIAGDNLADIQASAIEADKLYNYTGINSCTLNNSISVYPNPAIDNITIESHEQAIIKITNILGQLVKTLYTIGNKTSIDISAFPSGVYIVEVKTKSGVGEKKFVKD